MKLAASLILAGSCLSACPVSAQTAWSEAFLEAPGPTGRLKGTFLLPRATPSAVVLIIPGSGPTDRDGNSPMGIRASTYRLLAEGLAARGVATLRIDKRGMFASAAAVPDANAVTVADYVSDVDAWVRVLKQKTSASCVWILGHSEGGLIALASATVVRSECGLLLVATPARPMGEVLRGQLMENPANAPIMGQASAAIDSLTHGHRVDIDELAPALQGLFNPAVQGFLISAFSYDPSRLISGVDKPVLVMQGQSDLQIREQDARLLKKAHPEAELVLLATTNHVLKTATLDDPRANMATYADPDVPLAAGVVDAITAFLARNATVAGP